jgi:hypothetical protein
MLCGPFNLVSDSKNINLKYSAIFAAKIMVIPSDNLVTHNMTILIFVTTLCLSEISGSYGNGYEDGCLLVCCTV